MSASFDPYCDWLGIPPSDQPPDRYRLLGIERFEHDPDVVAAAADRQIAFVLGLQKGDRAGMAQRLLNELSTARTCLLNPAARAEYDAALKSRMPEGATSDRRIARPAPRSSAEPPAGSHPPVGTAPSPAPVPGAPTAAIPSQGPAWPPGAFGPATASPGNARPPTGPTVGQTPAYTVPPPPGPTVSPNVGTGPPPVSEPPVPSQAAPTIAVGAPPTIVTQSFEVSAADEEDSTRNRQLWLLAAIVVVVVLGTGLTVAVITFGLASKPSSDGHGDGGASAVESISGPLVEQQADGGLHFSAADAVIRGDTPTRALSDGREVITNWTSSSDWLTWDFRVEQPRMFRVELIYEAPAGYGGTFSVAIDDMKREAAVRDKSGADAFSPHDVGFLTVRRSGRYQLDMRVVQKPAGQLMILRAIRLTPYEIGYVR